MSPPHRFGPWNALVAVVESGGYAHRPAALSACQGPGRGGSKARARDRRARPRPGTADTTRRRCDLSDLAASRLPQGLRLRAARHAHRALRDSPRRTVEALIAGAVDLAGRYPTRQRRSMQHAWARAMHGFPRTLSVPSLRRRAVRARCTPTHNE